MTIGDDMKPLQLQRNSAEREEGPVLWSQVGVLGVYVQTLTVELKAGAKGWERTFPRPRCRV